jgi:hypothetical protein
VKSLSRHQRLGWYASAFAPGAAYTALTKSPPFCQRARTSSMSFIGAASG